MPQLDLTETEAKVLWVILDRGEHREFLSDELRVVEDGLFAKVYRAYRGMPPQEAA